MRRSAIPLALALGLAALSPAQSRRSDDRSVLAGTYATTQSKDRIERTLILDGDGKCELDTVYDAVDRRDMSRSDVRKFGTTAQKARNTGHGVKHVGRWEVNGSRLRLRLKDVIGDLKGDESFDVDLDYRDGAFVFDKDTEAYGTERMSFRRSDPWPDSRPWKPRKDSGRDDRRGSRDRSDRLGVANYDGRKLDLDDATLSGDGDDARLSVWIDGRRLDFRGTLKRRGDLATFIVERRTGTYGTFSLRLQDGDVRSVVGSGVLDYKSIILSN